MLVFVFSQELHDQDVTVAKVTRRFHCGDGGQIVLKYNYFDLFSTGLSNISPEGPAKTPIRSSGWLFTFWTFKNLFIGLTTKPLILHQTN